MWPRFRLKIEMNDWIHRLAINFFQLAKIEFFNPVQVVANNESWMIISTSFDFYFKMEGNVLTTAVLLQYGTDGHVGGIGYNTRKSIRGGVNEEYIEAARTSLLHEKAAVAASVHTSVSESRLVPLSRELRGWRMAALRGMNLR